MLALGYQRAFQPNPGATHRAEAPAGVYRQCEGLLLAFSLKFPYLFPYVSPGVT